MKRDWRRRAAARPWLLLRPGQPWDWLLLEAGCPPRAGQGRPPENLQARVALILPGEACSLFQVAAPPGLKREEWPLLLEDRLLQPADEVICACLSREARQLRLLAVARGHVEPWLAQLAEWGLQAERCWAEFQLLAMPEPGMACAWQRTEQATLRRGLDAQGQEHWLYWPHALGDVPQQPWAGLREVAQRGAWPSPLAPLDPLPSLFDRPRQRLALPVLSQQQQRLAVACLVLACAWGGLWLHQQWRQVHAWRAQVLAVTGEQAGPRQAAQALKRLRAGEQQRLLRERQLEALQARLQAWLGEHPGWHLQAVRFDGQRWHLRLSGDGAAPPWGEMASTVGASVQEQAGQVVFDLGAEA
ncbi:type II secretion system protein GspL [Pantoea sp. Tr-811]|uniref:GspL/Epsl periplasmic domain-containing protein n=1 Tax=Pantoea sp. Tr-811 TaxID=2608361 RepID=UPI0014203940|nr:type II secretion system protein GspL [Pantoea sp. Tr-811]NIF29613.1 type II secretion system protein GspL [Pantoea sp. Tr-811]